MIRVESRHYCCCPAPLHLADTPFSLDKQKAGATASSDSASMSQNRIGPYSVQIKQRWTLLKTFAVGHDATSLGARATRSGIWVGVSFVTQRTLQFLSNLILTRLLFPEAFGLMALSSVFLVGLAMFSDLGTRPAIIRDPRGNDTAFLNTAWTIQVVRGATLFSVGCLLAYPISLIYEQPILFPLLAALSTTAVIAGFSSVKTATAERDLDFKTLSLIQIAGQVISIAAMVALAYTLRSVWALAIGNIIGTAVTVLLGHAVLRGHQHRFMIEPESVKSLIHFGRWIFLSTIVTFLGGEGLRAIQAGFLTPAEFGVLAIAYTIAAIPIDLSIRLTGSIGLPALSDAYRNRPDRLPEVLNKFRQRTLALSLLMVTAVVFTSEAFVELLYDERYHAAGAFVVAITLSNAVTLIFAGYNNALLALGKSKTYLSIMSFSAVARIIGLSLGFHVFGLLGMIIGIGVANVAILIAVCWTAHRERFMFATLDIISLIIIVIIAAVSVHL